MIYNKSFFIFEEDGNNKLKELYIFKVLTNNIIYFKIEIRWKSFNKFHNRW